MDSASLLPLLEQLDDHVDDLEEALEPLLGQSLSKTSKNLPVMDKAKLHVFVTYTLESLLFSYLRLYGVNATQHPVYRELTRVKQYFAKIKALETEPEQRKMTLDKGAANRFVKHGLPKKMAAEAQNPSAQNDGASSAAPSTAQSTADSDLDSDEETNTDAQPSGSDKEKVQKQKKKEEKIKAKSKKARKLNKAERNDEKRERRKKKEKTRKAQKA
ncbi:uncharacterized protein N7484_007583 [Penicillium longicatenatum]|uniref:uncharacterized protein n=1 Tax=Penicillium longicatenatum TaxID=1561947 RepID=UPI0025468B81|nr:uncharacterized protein N7484_007583 [Penicillium longicatenatum]KAJ5639721.1 hypothetical protein N7484_007583 [Penicillium longicatenatum]